MKRGVGLASVLASSKAAPMEVVNRVVDCRSVGDAAERLKCFDTAVAVLAEAQAADDLAVVSKKDMREARRGLFGLSLPRLKLFGGGEDDDEGESNEFRELTSTIASARQGARGYVFSLPDGAVWEQTDNTYLGNVREGQTVVIRRAALGSYMATVGTSRAARVKRIK